MSETNKTPQQTPSSSEPKSLDDVLLAMDVVDTLRHREQLVARELDTELREKELIERLREIYRAQGIDVPDYILRDGVKALAERRFVYTPPKKTLSVRLARVYVRRDRWLKPAAILASVILAGLAIWQVGFVMPQQARAAEVARELSEGLPQAVSEHLAEIEGLTNEAVARQRANDLAALARSQIAQEDAVGARATINALSVLKQDIASSYQVRVVYGPDEPFSGVFRVSNDDPGVTNYYLIVEATNAAGQPVQVETVNEEDPDERRRVSRWGQRVPQSTFEQVAADKRDDQIIQGAEIGRKPAGQLMPVWTVDVSEGAILEW